MTYKNIKFNITINIYLTLAELSLIAYFMILTSVFFVSK